MRAGRRGLGRAALEWGRVLGRAVLEGKRRGGGWGGIWGWGAVALVGVTCATVGILTRGLVAGLIAGTYATAITRVVAGKATSQHREHLYTRGLDAVSCLAADLRAGLPPVSALKGILDQLNLPVTADPSLTAEFEEALGPARGRFVTAWRLAERTGAPLADLLDILVHDLRAEKNRRARISAQLSGVKSTVVILVALPIVGIVLGYAMGVNSLHILLDTTVGAECVFGALFLQLVGVGWISRLVRHAAT